MINFINVNVQYIIFDSTIIVLLAVWLTVMVDGMVKQSRVLGSSYPRIPWLAALTGVILYLVAMMISLRGHFWINSNGLEIVVRVLEIGASVLIASGAFFWLRTIVNLTKKLEALSVTDELTGLMNRRGFIKSLDQLLDNGKKSCIVILDVNRFKNINDCFGHLEGDKALRHVAAVLIPPLEGDEIACRYGGDEFAVLLRGGDERARDYMTKVEKLLSRLPVIGIFITLSWGMAVHPEEGVNVEALFSTADARLYVAKG